MRIALLLGPEDQSLEPAGKDRAKSGDVPVKLSIDDAVHNWGTVYQGQVVSHTFTLKNDGSEAFTIKEIKTRCSCTFASENARNRRLEPGESIRVGLRLETSRLPSEQIRKPGPIRKSGEVVTDGNRIAGTLWLEGVIRELLRFEPPSAILETVRDDDAAGPEPLKVIATSQVDKPVRIKAVRGDKRVVAARVMETKAGSAFEIELRSLIPLSTTDSRHSDTLQVTTSVEGIDVELPLPVKVLFKSRIQVYPSQSFFFPKTLTARLGQPGASPPRKVLSIRSIGNPDHRFRITKVETENKRFRTLVESAEEGRRYKLTVELLPLSDDTKRLIRDKILIETDDPLVPRITIPGIAQR